jgi:hypothetical protein
MIDLIIHASIQDSYGIDVETDGRPANNQRYMGPVARIHTGFQHTWQKSLGGGVLYGDRDTKVIVGGVGIGESELDRVSNLVI